MRTTRERARDAILGVFTADAAAAGLHWIYDVEEVRRRGGEHPEFQPLEGSDYHGRRRLGQSTHYGDHALVALQSIVERDGLDPDDLRERFRARFGDPGYDGYLDHATKDVLETGRGADDNQAGCFATLAMVVARHAGEEDWRAKVEEAIRVTHDHTQAVRYGLLAAEAIAATIGGATVEDAAARAAEGKGAAAALARKALEAGEETTEFAVATGQGCPVPNSLPVALHTALNSRGFEDVVRRSILAGGDSAGRLFVSAALRGAADGVPPGWWMKVERLGEIDALTEKLLDRANVEA